jgi:hypothetical protein
MKASSDPSTIDRSKPRATALRQLTLGDFIEGAQPDEHAGAR